jgi:hypothetical protein
MTTTMLGPTTQVEAIARVCHEANRAFALAIGEDPTKVYPDWSAAPEEIRESARVGVEKALAGATPRELHESWCATKTADGWVYGPTKDLAAKTHFCLVPYDELPQLQRLKDALFQSIVGALKG